MIVGDREGVPEGARDGIAVGVWEGGVDRRKLGPSVGSIVWGIEGATVLSRQCLWCLWYLSSQGYSFFDRLREREVLLCAAACVGPAEMHST